MNSEHITLRTKVQDGKVILHTEIPASPFVEEYDITIEMIPHLPPTNQTLDQFYGALAENPLPEIARDTLPEQRDDLEVSA